MADIKLSDRLITTIVDGGYLYIIIPDGGGGFLSKRILASTFQNPIDLPIIDKLVAQGAPFTKAFDAGTLLERIDFQYVSGTNVKIKVGITVGGDEVSITELPVPNGGNLPLVNVRTFEITETLYITITGGVLNINFKYIPNYF